MAPCEIMTSAFEAPPLGEHASQELAFELLGSQLVRLLYVYGAVFFYNVHHVRSALELVGPSEVGRAGVYDVDHGCALVDEGVMNGLLKLYRMISRAPRHERRPCRLRHLAGVERGLA